MTFNESLENALPFLAHALMPSTFHEDTLKSHLSPPFVLQSLLKSMAEKSESVLLSLAALAGGPPSPAPTASEGAPFFLLLGGMVDVGRHANKCLNFIV